MEEMIALVSIKKILTLYFNIFKGFIPKLI